MPPRSSMLLPLWLPGLLLAPSLTAAGEGLCAAGGACAEEDVERAEDFEASALRVELLQQRSEHMTARVAVGALAEVAVGAAGAQPPTPPEQEDGSLTEVPPDDEEELSAEGPFDEEPDDAEAERPRPAVEGWNASEDASTSDLGSGWWRHDRPGSQGWGRPGWGHDPERPGWGGSTSSFCQSHHVGFFCQGTTRTRCCRQGRYYQQCGSTTHSTACGWHGGGYNPGGYHPGYPGGYHPGWHPWLPPGGYDHFCEEHHTGTFCSHHTRISCCKRGWHFVSCTTTSRTRSYC
uniref:Uncharacterized protein n=1 Tax=Alexandrium monilatum TaxID=311494 RepID=A0A7S4QK97_9DINO